MRFCCCFLFLADTFFKCLLFVLLRLVWSLHRTFRTLVKGCSRPYLLSFPNAPPLLYEGRVACSKLGDVLFIFDESGDIVLVYLLLPHIILNSNASFLEILDQLALPVFGSFLRFAQPLLQRGDDLFVLFLYIQQCFILLCATAKLSSQTLYFMPFIGLLALTSEQLIDDGLEPCCFVHERYS